MLTKLKRLTSWHNYIWLAKQVDRHKGPLLLVILLHVLVSLSGVAVAAVSKLLIDAFMAHDKSLTAWLIALFALLLIAQTFANPYLTYRTGKLRETMSHGIQLRFMERYYRTDWKALNNYPNGDIQTRLVSDVGSVVDGWTNTVPTIIAMIFQLIAAFGTLWYFDPTLAIYAFLLGPVSILFSWLIGRKLKRMQLQVQASESNYRSYLTESVRHILIIKTFENQRRNLDQVQSLQQQKLFWVLKRNLFNALVNTVITLGYRAGFFIAFIIGASRLARGTVSFGTFTAFLQLVAYVQGPMEGLSRTLPMIISSLASAERLREMEQLPNEDDRRQVEHSPSQTTAPIASVDFDRVSYGYDPNQPVLRNISFTIQSGEIISIVGTSGEGKTTLLRLLLALITPQEGQSYIRTTAGEALPIGADTRAYFSYVPQGNTLFSGTIRDNLIMGYPSATDDELREAARSACALDFIEKLPLGFETVIGENGIGLSEGQAQRIAIARALLRPAPILLLDEATSALDLDTEMEVLKRIKQLSPHRTCIAITHRLSVIDICDQVYRIREQRLLKLTQQE
ncbi:ABC transporter ATP-binding protein [Paenibacillus soyae]|uniref:ABC transporter ATP-binding protein/permease n=1 Tax=Paenibacillus soyae TaxID=2969249 RepID=A0A9X2MW41_9BACL|nr:ABC transporter ATP-binding protein [Paenibacillus soyae]MCR2807407.1 ABC transporter ATP-binding protein/permease [Paenibacillus soyae]